MGGLSPLSDCRLIDLPRVSNVLGSLTFIEGERHVPFAIQRVYYLYDVLGGAERGGHAHRELQQLIIAMSGSFDVVLDDGYLKATLLSESFLPGLACAYLGLAGIGQFFFEIGVNNAGLESLRRNGLLP